MLSPVKLVVGLGNPGAKYYDTRHNAGFWFVESFAAKYSLSFNLESKFNAEVCRLQSAEINCWFCKPVNFMNKSGDVVQAITSFYKIPIKSMLLIHDELNLDAGIVRLKEDGGHGGHNGLRDIIEKTGERSFSRLRLGIGRPESKNDAVSYVLGNPSQQDRQLIDRAIESSMDVMPLVFDGDIQSAMNILHQN